MLCRLLVLSLFCCASVAYKDVVFIHGLLSDAKEFNFLTELIEQRHPGTKVHAVAMFENLWSVAPLWYQVEHIAAKIQPILTNPNSEGTVLLGYSQGAILSRGLLSVLKHNVETFISLSGPLAGQYGDTEYMKFLFAKYVKTNIYRLFYTPEGQLISLGNFWYDPHQQDLYKKHSAFLGVLNNETSVPDPRNKEFRANFLRLKNLVLIGGPDDGVITPWQSSHFGIFNENETVEPMTSQKWYLNDAFGLKTLNERGAIHMYSEPNITHHHWASERKIFDKYILPWL